MVSITACSKSRFDCRHCWQRLLAAVGLLFSLAAAAAEIDIANPQLSAVDDGYALAADFRINFNPRLEEMVARGVVLHFVAEFELTRPRWYWFDEQVVSRSLTYRLSYNALTRQYRLATGGLHQSFPTLAEALQVLARLRNWVVIERTAERAPERQEKGEKGEKAEKAEKAEKPEKAERPAATETYLAALRLRLDINQLPRPFQIAALGSKDWNLVSDWKTWPATLPADLK